MDESGAGLDRPDGGGSENLRLHRHEVPDDQAVLRQSVRGLEPVGHVQARTLQDHERAAEGVVVDRRGALHPGEGLDEEIALVVEDERRLPERVAAA